MKIILSISGGGKTKELVKNAVKYSSEGKLVHLITDEIAAFNHFAEKETNLNSSYVSHEVLNDLKDITVALIFNENSEVILIDVIPQTNQSMDKFLKAINKIFIGSSQEIYVTVQVPFESTLLDGEKLITLDYVDYIDKKELL